MTMAIRAVIFDLDGVLVRTDELHYRSWAALAAKINLPFSRETFDQRMRGRERSDALGEMLAAAGDRLPDADCAALAAEKDRLFLDLVARRGVKPIAGAATLIAELHRRSIRLAVGSSSRNARLVLGATGLNRCLDAVVDANDARGKPHPDIFLKAADRLGALPAECVVVEDAADGVEAARRAGMRVVAVGPSDRFRNADDRVDALAELTADRVLRQDS